MKGISLTKSNSANNEDKNIKELKSPSEGGEINQRINSETSQPDSARRRDPRKRMKKSISSKVYENAPREDISKLDESNGHVELQQIQIDTSMNKNNDSKYNAIDFLSQENTIQNDIHSPQQSFSNKLDVKSSVTANSAGGSQLQPSQVQGAQMPKRQKGSLVIDLHLTSSNQIILSTKQKVIRVFFFLLFLGYIAFNVRLSFQREFPHLKSAKNDNFGMQNEELFPEIDSHLKQNTAILRHFSKEIEECDHIFMNFLKIYQNKGLFFDLLTCSWVTTCSKEKSKIYANLCVSACPTSTKDIKSTCLSLYSSQIPSTRTFILQEDNQELLQCPESHFFLFANQQPQEPQHPLQCLQCDPHCFSCLSEKFCSKCQQGYYLQLGQCYSQCLNNNKTNSVTDEFMEEIQSGRCVHSLNKGIKYSSQFVNSQILVTRVFYELIQYPILENSSQDVSFILYFIHGEHSPSSQLEIVFPELQQYMKEFNNVLLVSLPSIPQINLINPEFYRFFYKELIPSVERQHTRPHSQFHRLIAGEGLGAFQAIWVAGKARPLLDFGYIGMINGFIRISDSIENHIDAPNEFVELKQNLLINTTLYTDFSGYQENSTQERGFNDVLKLSSNTSSSPKTPFHYIQESPKCSTDQLRQECNSQRYVNLFQSILDYITQINSLIN